MSERTCQNAVLNGALAPLSLPALCARRCRVHLSQLQGIVSEAEFPKFIEALQQPLPVEPYASNRVGGALIVVDPASNRTSGALLVRSAG